MIMAFLFLQRRRNISCTEISSLSRVDETEDKPDAVTFSCSAIILSFDTHSKHHKFLRLRTKSTCYRKQKFKIVPNTMQNLKFPIQKSIPPNHTYFCPFYDFFHTFDTYHTFTKMTILINRIVNFKTHLKKKQDSAGAESTLRISVNFCLFFLFSTTASHNCRAHKSRNIHRCSYQNQETSAIKANSGLHFQ